MKKTTARATALILLHFFLFLLLPDGLFQILPGKPAYARELGLYLSFGACLVLYLTKRDLNLFRFPTALLAAFGILLLPALLQEDSRIPAVLIIRWELICAAAFVAGYYCRSPRLQRIFFTLILGYLLVEATIGAYEIRTQSYFINTEDYLIESTFDMQVDTQTMLDEVIRVKGLQRIVFGFSNIMACGAVLSGVLLVLTQRWWARIAYGLTAAFFMYCLINSGGRSALLGMFWVSIYAALTLFDRRFATRQIASFIAIMFVIYAIISIIGIGNLATFISRGVFANSSIGDAGSAYARDDWWQEVEQMISNSILHSAIGGPVASLFDPRIVAVMITDNQYIWLFYHFGVLGLAVFIVVTFSFIRGRVVQSASLYTQPFLFFLVYNFGEAIARESFFFWSALFLAYTGGHLFGAWKQVAEPRLKPPEAAQADGTVSALETVPSISTSHAA